MTTERARWVWNTSREGPDITVRIGAVKIANVHLQSYDGRKTKCYVRFHDNEPKSRQCDSVSDAFKLIHEMLRSPPEEK